MATALDCRREDFSLPSDEHYLNCAYMAPLSKRVQRAGRESIATEAVPARLRAEDFFANADRLRALFSELIGLDDPSRVVAIPSVSYGLATVARNTTLERGQNVVILHEQFPSNVHVWRRSCEATGAELRVVRPPVEGPGRTAAWNEAILEAIDGDSALIAMGPVHWSDGTPFDLTAIGDRAREVGAAFVVDGTQSVGAAPFDVARIRPDALVCCGYKWLMGPYSLGVAYYGPRYDGGVPLEETWIAMEGSDDFASLGKLASAYRPGARRYEMGEPASFILMPMLIAALEQILDWSVEAIAAYTGALRDELFSAPALAAAGIETEDRGSRHLFGLRLPSRDAAESLHAALAASGVHVSVRGSAIRVSPHVYNDATDLEALLRGLKLWKP